MTGACARRSWRNGQPQPDLWPGFRRAGGFALCLIRGAGSDLLSPATFARMRALRPDAFAAEVPGRGHVLFWTNPWRLRPCNLGLRAMRAAAATNPP